MAFNLKTVLRAMLYSSSQPLGIKDVQGAFTRFHEGAEGSAAAGAKDSDPAQPAVAEESSEAADVVPADDELYADVPTLVTATQVREAMQEIAAELQAADGGLLLVEGATGYRLVTHPRFARWVRILRSEPTPVRLSASALETLAIVAYRQPVTRTEIEAIRGVSAEAGLARLLERDLISITGRADLPGRPLQYGTTEAFLEFSGLKSVEELPASDVLSTRQLDDWLKSAMSPTTLGDAEMGLPEEQLPLEAAAPAVSAQEGADAEAAEKTS
jgi:segregation and condensation protein B